MGFSVTIARELVKDTRTVREEDVTKVNKDLRLHRHGSFNCPRFEMKSGDPEQEETSLVFLAG